MTSGVTNLSNVQASIEAWKKEIPEKCLVVQEAVVVFIVGLDLDGRILVHFGLLTEIPVDTGVARSNVRTAASGAARHVAETFDPRSHFFGSHGDPPTSEERDRILQGMSGAKPFKTIWIVLAAPYSNRLNEGHSPQVQPGWIELTQHNASSAMRQLGEI